MVIYLRVTELIFIFCALGIALATAGLIVSDLRKGKGYVNLTKQLGGAVSGAVLGGLMIWAMHGFFLLGSI